LRAILKMASQCAWPSVKPLDLFLKPLSPAERLAAQQRDHEKLQRESAQGAGGGRGKGKGQVWEEACGVPRDCPWSSKSKSPPLTAPSGPPSGASIQNKCWWQVGKRRLLLWLREAHMQALTAVVLLMQPMASLPSSSSSTTQAAAASIGRLLNPQFISRQDPRKFPSDLKINPLTPLRI
jgi:hypothetical protein